MKEQLEIFFKSKGISKFVPEFSELQEEQIQSVIGSFYKPAFEELEKELNLYSNIKAVTYTSKKAIDSIKEDIEFSIIKASQSIFKYKPKFINENSEVKVIGQFCKLDIYGDDNEFVNTSLSKLITEITQQDIETDFTKAFTENVDIK